MALPLEAAPTKRSRREAIRLTGGAIAATSLYLVSEKNTPIAQTAPLAQVEALTPWNVIPFRKDRWFPLNPNSAAGPSLEKNALVTFDEKHQTNTAGEYRAWADERIARNPASKAVMEAYGNCHGAAAAIHDIAELQALRLITEDRAYEIINDEILFGLMVGRHMDDIQSRINPFNEAESVAHFIEGMRSPAVIPGVVEVDIGLAGVWYFMAHGYRGASILVSGFGESKREVSPEQIKRAYYPIPRQGAATTINRTLVLETAYLSNWKKDFTNARVDQDLGLKR